jgi:hypothetical protein
MASIGTAPWYIKLPLDRVSFRFSRAGTDKEVFWNQVLDSRIHNGSYPTSEPRTDAMPSASAGGLAGGPRSHVTSQLGLAWQTPPTEQLLPERCSTDKTTKLSLHLGCTSWAIYLFRLTRTRPYLHLADFKFGFVASWHHCGHLALG